MRIATYYNTNSKTLVHAPLCAVRSACAEEALGSEDSSGGGVVNFW